MIDDGRVRDFGKSMEMIEEDYVRRAYDRYQRCHKYSGSGEIKLRCVRRREQNKESSVKIENVIILQYTLAFAREPVM